MRGGHRRRHCPAALSPAQVRAAARKLEAGKLIKQLVIELGVHRGTLYRALNGQGAYAGILPTPLAGRPGGRPLLPIAKVARARAMRAARMPVEQVARKLNVSDSTARAAIKGCGAYAGVNAQK